MCLPRRMSEDCSSTWLRLRHALLLLPLVPLGLALRRSASFHVLHLHMRLRRRCRPSCHERDLLIRARGLVGALRLADRLRLHVLVFIGFSIELQDDIERLGEHVRDKVRQESGVELRWEIRRLGRPLSPQETLYVGGQDA